MGRNILAGFVGIIVALTFMVIGVWFELRFTTFGAFIWTANHASTQEVVRRFPDPFAVIGRAVLVSRWLLSPFEAFLSAGIARLIARRTRWAISVAVAMPIAVLALAADFGVAALAASCFYLLAAYGGMKTIDAAHQPREVVADNC
jgi:hypothetical protein